MFSRLLSRLEKVSVASTEEERDAIARFCYEVYVRELGHDNLPGVCHDTETLRDAFDHAPNVRHLYVGPPDAIQGVLRIILWAPGQVDEEFAALYAMDTIPGIDALATAEIGRLMIRPTLRGRMVLPSLATAAYELMVREHDVSLAFCECRPGLIASYRKLGFRPYGAKATKTAGGLMVPLISVTSDVDYYRAVGTVFLRSAERIFVKEGKPRLESPELNALFADDRQRIEVDQERVWSTTQEALAYRPERHSMFAGLSERQQRAIIRGGLAIDVAAGDDAIVEGKTEQELYIVLEGEFEVVVDGHTVAVLVAGDVFGEMAFFADDHHRRATVRALGESRILSLKRSFWERLRRDDSDAAVTLLLNLGRILSERLHATNHSASV